ncbi:dihydroxy-acid dehydratase [Pseudoponticoccus marisrubri]|uniref:dihydroxy-acid dehydratase n=1 Tax=Pseudoponticoccus marisrubri TaxID=1685382 RepID=UPI000BFF0DA6|nr:dihydroxy-acid dehydratase [Pseudoponticoccus marisrubri]
MRGRVAALTGLAGLTLLAGCATLGRGIGSGPPPEQVRLVGGDVVVAGPPGYCIDRKTLESRAQRGFAMIASCHILSGGKRGTPVDPLLVSVAVGPNQGGDALPSPQTLAEEAGAQLIGGERREGFVTAHLGSGGDTLLEGGDARHWRAAFFQGTHIVVLGLYAPEDSALADRDGGALLARVRDRIRALSPEPAAPGEVAEAAPRRPGLFGRLFNPQDLP